MPLDVTSLLQLMDQGVLQNIKLAYKKQFLRFLIEEDSGSLTLLEKIKKINLKDVGYWSAESWDNVSEQTLRRSWKRMWPTLTYEQTSEENNEAENLIDLKRNIPGWTIITLHFLLYLCCTAF